MNGENLQSAIYGALTSDATLMALVTGVYADVQQPIDSGSNTPFPYVTIGSDNLGSWDSKTFFGTEALCQIDIWSRQNNYTEAKQIGSAITDVLHQQPLTIANASHVLTTQQSATYSKDPDGHTKRGMLMFRVVFVRS
jgi:hypothetical protein